MRNGILKGIIFLVAAIAIGFCLVLVFWTNPFVRIRKEKPVNSPPPLELPEQKNAPKPINSADFALGQVRLQMSVAEIQQILGEPDEKSIISEPSIHNPDYTTYFETWIYPGVEIIFINNAPNDAPVPAPGPVFAIIATSPQYATPRGLKIGDRMDKLFEEYGQTKASEGFFVYEKDLSSLNFSLKNGLIDRIEVHQYLD